MDFLLFFVIPYYFVLFNPTKANIMTSSSIHVVIAKPTKQCNADCSYCSAVTADNTRWTLESFKRYFDALRNSLAPNCDWIWHGGEPMLMGPEFFIQAKEYTDSLGFTEIRYAMQSNLLLYKKKLWLDCFKYVFQYRVSTSYDPSESMRTIQGNSEKYNHRFFNVLKSLHEDHIHPLAIGVYTNETAQAGIDWYHTVKNMGDASIPLRYNYCYPAGRFMGTNEAITPDNYTKLLMTLLDHWLKDAPNFTITPLDVMLLKTVGKDGSRCPWTKECGGHFLSLEPGGEVFNCSEFADLNDSSYSFGNLNTNTLPDIFNSIASRQIRQRRIKLPMDCTTCPQFKECEGGCARDAVLFDKGITGKFHYCSTWKTVFARLKEAVLSGEADAVLTFMGLSPHECKEYVAFQKTQTQDAGWHHHIPQYSSKKIFPIQVTSL